MYSYLDDEDQQNQPDIKSYLAQKYNLDPQSFQPVAQPQQKPLVGPPSPDDDLSLNPLASTYRDKRMAAEKDLAERDSRVNNASLFSNLGDVIAGKGVGSGNKFFENLKQSNEKDTVGKLKEIEESDPNSETSKGYQSVLLSMGLDAGRVKSLSAIEAKALSPLIELKYKADQARLARQDSNNMRSLILHDRADAKKTAQDDKDSNELDSFLSKGWTGKSGQAGKVQEKINSAEAVQALIDQGKTQDGGLDSRQMEEAALASGRLLGATAMSQVQALIPRTAFGGIQSIREYIDSNPHGAGQQAFVKRLEETVQREKALAETQKRQYQVEGLAARSGFKKRNPDQFSSILRSKGIADSMIDENGRYRVPEQTGDSDTVTIQTPDGRTGEIPRANLKEALKRGAKEVQ